MRRFLRLLCAAALGVTVLGALPAEALEPTRLAVSSADPLLNENGDGFWESATVVVSTDADVARWTLRSASGAVVAAADLTPEQIEAARGQAGAALPVDSVTTGLTLAAGTYTFTVTATATGKDSSTGSTKIHVSTAPPLTALSPSVPVFYPWDIYAGAAHGVTFRHGLDARVVQHGAARFEIVGPDGRVGSWPIDASDPLLRWDGRFRPAAPDGVSPWVSPGTYFLRLVVRDDGRAAYGPMSEPVAVSWAFRAPRTYTTTQTANATRTATLTQRGARLRVVDGRFRYRAFNTDWRSPPIVRTAHVVRIPSNRVLGFAPVLTIRGRWQYDLDIDLEAVTPAGKVVNIDLYRGVDTEKMSYAIPRRWIRANGTFRFRLLWSSYGTTGDPGRTGRTASVSVGVTRFVWRDVG